MQTQAPFRVLMISLAALLACFSFWMLLAELTRSSIRRLPTNSEAATTAASARGFAGWAAKVGVVRGDLWSAYAFTYATLLWPRSRQGPDATAVANEARAVVEKALAYAPHDASLWLLAASLGSQFTWWSSGHARILNMSYYTGLSEPSLTPLRLHVATRSSALADSEIQQFVQRDIRMILTRWKELKPALIATYKDAAPEPKRFLEAAVADIDPSFLPTLRESTRK
jgi:hypothetical protein